MNNAQNNAPGNHAVLSLLKAMRGHIAKNGFVGGWVNRYKKATCGCFWGTANIVLGNDVFYGQMLKNEGQVAETFIRYDYDDACTALRKRIAVNLSGDENIDRQALLLYKAMAAIVEASPEIFPTSIFRTIESKINNLIMDYACRSSTNDKAAKHLIDAAIVLIRGKIAAERRAAKKAKVEIKIAKPTEQDFSDIDAILQNFEVSAKQEKAEKEVVTIENKAISSAINDIEEIAENKAISSAINDIEEIFGKFEGRVEKPESQLETVHLNADGSGAAG